MSINEKKSNMNLLRKQLDVKLENNFLDTLIPFY